MAVLFDERGRGADLAGGAVAALEGVVLEEGGLDGAEGFAVGEAFDGGDFGAAGGDGEGEAGVDAAAVDENGAGSALAVVAAFLAASEVEVLAQGVEERGAGVERKSVRGAVDLEGEIDRGGGSSGVVCGGQGRKACSRGGADHARCLEEATAGDFDFG